MALDPERLVSRPPIVTRQTLTRRDTILYALGVGEDGLDFVFEERLRALPTMAVVMSYPGFIWRDPALGVDWKKILHGEQALEIFAPLPVEGEIVGETTIDALIDKGADKGAIAYVTRKISDGAGNPLATVRASTFLRGDGGFGRNLGTAPASLPGVPDRAPDETLILTTAKNQALIYRLSGDYNPLHIDPEVAAAGGFKAPILHGLCTYGFAGRAILAGLCAGDPPRLKRLDVRFTTPVFPGETLETQIWRTGEGTASFRTRVVERDLLALNNGYVEFK